MNGYPPGLRCGHSSGQSSGQPSGQSSGQSSVCQAGQRQAEGLSVSQPSCMSILLGHVIHMYLYFYVCVTTTAAHRYLRSSPDRGM